MDEVGDGESKTFFFFPLSFFSSLREGEGSSAAFPLNLHLPRRQGVFAPLVGRTGPGGRWRLGVVLGGTCKQTGVWPPGEVLACHR